MKNILFISIACLFFGSNSFSQAGQLPVYEIKSDTAEVQVLDSSYWQILQDKDGVWSFKDVSKPPLSEKFQFRKTKDEIKGKSGRFTYWIRYRLKNIMKTDASISLTSYADYYDVYLVIGNALKAHYKSGTLRKWDEKDGLKSVGDGKGFGPGAIPLVLKPGEEMLIFDRRSNGMYFVPSVRLLSTEKLIQKKYVDYVDSRENYFAVIHLQEAFVLGLLMLSIFLNIFFYKVAGEKVYLHFALYALFLSINRLSNISWAYTTWEQPHLLGYVRYLSYAWAFIPYFFIQFFRHFLHTKSAYPKWDKFLYFLAISNFVSTGLTFLSEIFLYNLFSIFYPISSFLSFLFIPLFIVITLLFFIKKKENSTRYLIIGAMPLLLFFLLVSPIVVFGVESDFGNVIMYNFRLIEVVCITWLVLSFSLVLALRFERLREENMQQALENERLAREKEMEKNELIEKQKVELELQVAERTADLKRSLHDLKSAQAQLIQAEKMASLGELTAGIAHEIQNPLNFVNNFSEVSIELIQEVQSERRKIERDEELVNELLKDIEMNLDKIQNHGKRADGIVKGMLQHSRTSNGQKELTDINALCDEYLRLAYHGLKAKDQFFKASFHLEADKTLPMLNVVPQDMGRVLLNLINNAFQACTERLALSEAEVSRSTVDGFGEKPTVIVSTLQKENTIEIKVTDNGPGIPEAIRDKIFQPFFTTKPTGQGTGLGLSLSYDIVKAHGGELKVESEVGKGSEFVIQLPAKNNL